MTLKTVSVFFVNNKKKLYSEVQLHKGLSVDLMLAEIDT